MADEEKTENAEEGEATEAEAKSSPLPWILVTVLCGGLGVAVPFLMPMSATDADLPEPEPEVMRPKFEPPALEDTAFVPFDSVVVNLDEGSMTRYLRITMSVQVSKEDELTITEQIEKNRVLLKNWLINRISDKNLDEIRGAVGQNRLRREIRDEFNTVLFPDGFDRIYDVLFEDYNVQ